MRALRGNHIIAGHRGGVSACWRRAGVAAAALALPLAAAGIAAAPASAAAGYMVTHTISVGSSPYGVAVDPAAHTVYVTNDGGGTVSVIDEATDAVTHTIPVGSGAFGCGGRSRSPDRLRGQSRLWHRVSDRRGH